ncbi:hypothetical protein FOVG_08363 [Fusarium oxysporum f. sp. pisi HDV247]|uniref:Myb-like domain-containing protein n=1 Tax=Fusarium oxysporum f. sp. pisi HDV247 TaxID=1080344 RepID=W9PK62_FUSOX|nr:hypothetical protein FOVG_08363 [Fusarium oxysporum f. sp. pisi HDV247]
MTDNSDKASVQLWPWQKRALENGRTPLPESPGERPWLNLSPDTEISATPLTALINASTPKPRDCGEYHQIHVVTPHSRWWSESDMRRLIHLRNSGESWAAISAEFPGRTLQGVKQTYRKRRFATERQMEKEAFAATSAEPSLIDDDDEKSN